MSSSQEEAREARRLRRNERDRDYYYYYYCFYSTAAGFIVMFNYSIVWMKMISYTQVIHGVGVAREE